VRAYHQQLSFHNTIYKLQQRSSKTEKQDQKRG